MKVRLRLYGVFKSTSGIGDTQLDITAGTTVRNAILQLVSQPSFSELRHLLLQSNSSDPRPNALIMISGREISALKGLDTMLEENDELALLPVVHGG
jgi:molybdopterin converting factor small subunit